MNKVYRNIGFFFGVILLFIMVAFTRTYFGLFPRFDGISVSIHFHVAMILLWFGLLLVQPMLIRMKKLQVHRLLGKISYVTFPLLVLSCMMMTYNDQIRHKNPAILMVNIADVSMLVLFYVLAIVYRKRTPWHIRFMILTALPFLSPAAGRLPMPPGIFLEMVIMAALLVVERFNQRVYRPYLLALGYTLILTAAVICALNRPEFMDVLWNFIF